MRSSKTIQCSESHGSGEPIQNWPNSSSEAYQNDVTSECKRPNRERHSWIFFAIGDERYFSRAVGLVNLNSGIQAGSEGGVPEFSMWPFVADTYNVFGYILRGERPTFLRFAAEQLPNAVVNVTTWVNFTHSALTPVVEDLNRSVPVAIASQQDVSDASQLAKAIRATHSRTVLDNDVVESARRAVDEACAFVERELPNYSPTVMLSDDGVVMLQWRSPDTGVLLIFTGDGTGSFSIKKPGGRYSEGTEEFSIAGAIPVDARAAIDSIVSS
jgi:hypothetical protein